MSRPGGGWFSSNHRGFTGGARPPANHAQRRGPPAQSGRDGYAYGVHIVKHGNGIMGLQLDGNLFIRQVNDGLVKEWNMANKHAEVLVGDQIVFVNGIQGDVDAMFAAIKTQSELRMTLHRYTTSSQYPASTQAPQQLTEEEQLQWAIRRSMEDAAAASSAAPAGDTQMPQTSAASLAASEGQELGKAVAKADGFMDAAEVQKLLEAAEARHAQVAAERSELRQQVTENESIIKGLTDQLDAVNKQLREKTAKCEALEATLTKSKRTGLAGIVASSGAPDSQQVVGEEEQQGVVSQLLVRIQELEATLQQATHFAPVEKSPEEEVAEAAAVASAEGVQDASDATTQPQQSSAAAAADAASTTQVAPAEQAAEPATEQPQGAEVAEAEATSTEAPEATNADAPAACPDGTDGKDEAPTVLDSTGDAETAASADVTATEVTA